MIRAWTALASSQQQHCQYPKQMRHRSNEFAATHQVRYGFHGVADHAAAVVLLL
jgi:hypothetical protein